MIITKERAEIEPGTVFPLGSVFLDRGTIFRTKEPVLGERLFMVESSSVSISPVSKENFGDHARNVKIVEGRFKLLDWGVWMEPETEVELIAQVDPETMAEIEERKYR